MKENSGNTNPNAGQDTTDGNEKPRTITRFFIKNLQGGRGFSPADLRVDLLQEDHGLLDLAVHVFGVLREEKKTSDNIYSHLWSLTFNGTKYDNGWRQGCEFRNMKHIDEEDPRPLQNLKVEKGSKGSFQGESASFEFYVEEMGIPISQSMKDYPKVSKVPNAFGSDLCDDWISEDQKKICLALREQWSNYWKGPNNSCKRKRGPPFGVVVCKPMVPEWSTEELELLGLLINAGQPFKKSWKAILQYALVARAESATSGQWYKLKKAGYRLEWFGPGMSSVEQMLLVKRLAKNSNWKAPPSQAEIQAEREQFTKRVEQLQRGYLDSDDEVY